MDYNDTEGQIDHFTPCACARGKKRIIHWECICLLNGIAHCTPKWCHMQSSWMSVCDKNCASIKLTKYPKIGANNAEENGAIAITSPVIYGGASLSAAWMVKR